MIFEAPRPITQNDDVSGFCCGKDDLDRWLKNRARKNEGKATRTYVLRADGQIAGFYALAVGSVSRELAPGALRRNMPEPIPAMLLARLAVDARFHGQGLGMGLLRDSLIRTKLAASIAGIRVMMVNAIDEGASGFYRKFGFLESPGNKLLLLLPLSEIESRLVF